MFGNNKDRHMSYKSGKIHKHQGSLVAQLEKNPHAMQETPVQSLGQEDLLEKG